MKKAKSIIKMGINYFINFFKIKFLLNYKKLISIIKILLTINKKNSQYISQKKDYQFLNNIIL